MSDILLIAIKISSTYCSKADSLPNISSQEYTIHLGVRTFRVSVRYAGSADVVDGAMRTGVDDRCLKGSCSVGGHILVVSELYEATLW